MAQELEFQLQVKGPDREQLFIIPQGASIIGRQPGSHLLLEEAKVSRKHAQIDCTPTECRITDLGSSNGTFVNNQQLTAQVPILLKPGDIIKIGSFEITVEGVPASPPIAPEPKVEAPAEAPPKPKPRKAPPPRKEPPAPPPSGPPPAAAPPRPPEAEPAPEEDLTPPGLSIYSRRLMGYLPGIFHTDFMARFLGIFEAIQTPIEWDVDNFDLFLSPGTAPQGFIPWLENWFALPPGPNWSEGQRRIFLKEAHMLYARRGTRWALSRVLEIYTGKEPEIIEENDELDPHTFKVKVPLRKRELNPAIIEAIIDTQKPAHTTYKLEFRR